MKQSDQSRVADFLLRKTPKELVKGLSLLENLKLPIHDKLSFQDQLKEFSEKNDDEIKPIIGSLMKRFSAQDFPILSVESAFEKYWDKYQPFPHPFPDLFSQLELEGDFRQEPAICDVYSDYLTRFAANCACRAYQSALRQGVNQYRAVIIGHYAGQRAERTGECDG